MTFQECQCQPVGYNTGTITDKPKRHFYLILVLQLNMTKCCVILPNVCV